jgi:transcription antitermination protein NusB
MLPRSKARKRALDILHAADVTDRAAIEILAQEEEPVPPFARAIVHGVAERRAEIDAMISAASDRWTIERMPSVDRNLLRIGVFELLYSTDTPPGVAINEAVELAKVLSTEDSGRFVNGVLGRIAREHSR